MVTFSYSLYSPGTVPSLTPDVITILHLGCDFSDINFVLEWSSFPFISHLAYQFWLEVGQDLRLIVTVVSSMALSIPTLILVFRRDWLATLISVHLCFSDFPLTALFRGSLACWSLCSLSFLSMGLKQTSWPWLSGSGLLSSAPVLASRSQCSSHLALRAAFCCSPPSPVLRGRTFCSFHLLFHRRWWGGPMGGSRLSCRVRSSYSHLHLLSSDPRTWHDLWKGTPHKGMDSSVSTVPWLCTVQPVPALTRFSLTADFLLGVQRRLLRKCASALCRWVFVSHWPVAHWLFRKLSFLINYKEPGIWCYSSYIFGFKSGNDVLSYSLHSREDTRNP